MSAMPTYEESLAFMRDAVIDQRIDLTGPWQGWKIRKQYLVSPDGDRIMVREIVGMLIHYRAKFGHQSRKRVAEQPASTNVVSFAKAATEILTAKTRAEAARTAPRVQGGALRAP